ncbi:MAG: hypothetical protein AAGG02_16165, partial [Cyanobacteria bacterium P01_H01_bin.15]
KKREKCFLLFLSKKKKKIDSLEERHVHEEYEEAWEWREGQCDRGSGSEQSKKWIAVAFARN